jgi:hypothetical protein
MKSSKEIILSLYFRWCLSLVNDQRRKQQLLTILGKTGESKPVQKYASSNAAFEKARSFIG